jgi:hypothetical protein
MVTTAQSFNDKFGFLWKQFFPHESPQIEAIGINVHTNGGQIA